jgi:hypothetical protein
MNGRGEERELLSSPLLLSAGGTVIEAEAEELSWMRESV